MDTKLLKQKILDLAIHGKLVPQNPNDEPASKLLEKIREEKQRLIAEKKIKADKNDSYIFVGDDNRHYEKFADGTVKDIEDEIPFEVPEGWAWCRLKEIANTISSKPYQILEKNILKKGEFPVISQSANFIEGYTNENDYVLDKIPVTIFGDHTRNVKYVDFNFVVGADGVKILKCNSNINSQFFYNIILDASLKIENRGYGRHFQYIEKYLYALPPLNEQLRIVSEIEKFYQLIDTIEKNKVDLQISIKKAKSKILDLAIHGNLVKQNSSDEPASVLLEKLRAEKEAKIKAGELKRDKNDSYIYKNTTDNCYYEKFNGKEPVCIDEEIPFDIPDNWQWCRLNELGETNIGLIYHPTDLVNTGVPVLRSNNIQNDCLCLDDLARVQTKILDNQYVADGDILICARNGSQALVGKCTLIKDIPEKMAFGAFMAVFRSKYNDYILRYLQSFYFKDYMRESNSTQIYQLTQTMLKNALIPLPPMSEQKRIVSKIEEMFERLDQIQCNLI